MSSNGPVEKKTRIEGLDALRGLAIFGILVVNILQMFLPMFLASWPVDIVPGESGMWASWFLTDAFFENKFITIFSLLFGPVSVFKGSARAIRAGVREAVQSGWSPSRCLQPDTGGSDLLCCLLLVASSRRNPLRVGLAAVGRTALTNYVGQSVVMSLIATSYGLGLYGDLTHLQSLWLSMACFLVQMEVSVAWLRQFRMGPLEWIWRCLTYWQLLPLRGDPSS